MYGLNLGRLGLVGGKVSAAAFSPASLFASGEQGAWYDPSDLTTMFQDRAGTTPVTADGQTVGYILDKSGRGNHATAPSDAARPLYKTDGTYSWLQFDGVDDSLSTAAINLSVTQKVSAFSGVFCSAGDKMIYELSNTAANPGGFYLYSLSTVAMRSLVTGAISHSADTPYTTSANYVFAANLDISGGGPSVSTYVNGVASAQNATAATPTNFLNDNFYIGSRNNSIARLSGNIYSLIIRGALSTAGEIDDTETWVNGKTGAF